MVPQRRVSHILRALSDVQEGDDIDSTVLRVHQLRMGRNLMSALELHVQARIRAAL